jgi:hypothetical protein
MPGHEQVERTLRRIGVPHQATPSPDRRELVVAPRHQFVRVDLMPRVPDQPVMAKVENAVQRQAEFHNAQIRCEMGRTFADQIADYLSDLGSQLHKLDVGHLLQHQRAVDFGKVWMHHQLAIPVKNILGQGVQMSRFFSERFQCPPRLGGKIRCTFAACPFPQ